MTRTTNFLAYWGKTNTDPNGCLVSHPLAFHSLDVAAVVRRLVSDDFAGAKQWAETLRLSPDEFAVWAEAMAALHDLGKFSEFFQSKSAAVYPAELPPIDQLRACTDRHTVIGLTMLVSPAFATATARLFDEETDSFDAGSVWIAVAGHHGEPVARAETGKVCCAAATDAALAFTRAALALIDPPAAQLPTGERDLARFTWWFNGLLTVADWIGSDEARFPFSAAGDGEPVEVLRIYRETSALPRAAAAVLRAGLKPVPIRRAFSSNDLLGSGRTPSPLQHAAETVELPDGPLCVVIEDVTGAGKTEAALLLALRLIREGRASGLYFALPTMATANAMYDRLAGAYRAFFDGGEPSLVLAHGRRRDNEGFRSTLFEPDSMPRASVSDEAASEAICNAWMADDRRKSFLAQIGVGTIDQALLAVLPARHQTMRLVGLSDKVLILDEIHSADSFVEAEMQALLSFHAALGGNAILLSATLPSRMRKGLLNAFLASPKKSDSLHGQIKEAAGASDYPLVTVAARTKIFTRHCATRKDRERTVFVERRSKPEEAIAEVLQAASDGAACLYLRNTVDDAGRAYEAIRERHPKTVLFHARFAMADRLAIEEAVVRSLGRNGAAEDRRGLIVVGTQVLEASLDLCFDLIATDLAPIDLLIQRAGRLWRHPEREFRGGQSKPRMLVVSPDPEGDIRSDWLGPDLRGTGAVYEDHGRLWLTARTLFRAGAIVSPLDLRTFVEEVYCDDEAVPAPLQRQAEKADGKRKAEFNEGRRGTLDWTEGYRRTGFLWDGEDKVRTRLGGSDTLRLAVFREGRLHPMATLEGPRGWSLSEISVRSTKGLGTIETAGEVAEAVEALRTSWSRYEKELPILPFREEGDRFVSLGEGRAANVGYDRRRGLVLPNPRG